MEIENKLLYIKQICLYVWLKATNQVQMSGCISMRVSIKLLIFWQWILKKVGDLVRQSLKVLYPKE